MQQTKKQIAEASDAELKEFGETTLQLRFEDCRFRGDITAKISAAGWPADFIYVDSAEIEEAAQPQDEEARAEAQISLITGDSKNDPMWLIRLGSTQLPGGNWPAAVSVNGKNVVIQRGVEVKTPHRYVENLRNAVNIVYSQDLSTGRMSESESRNYPFEVIDRPSRAEIDEWFERTKDLVLA